MYISTPIFTFDFNTALPYHITVAKSVKRCPKIILDARQLSVQIPGLHAHIT
jgi:hypothetical protein